jgi:hypothetical protein
MTADGVRVSANFREFPRMRAFGVSRIFPWLSVVYECRRSKAALAHNGKR